MVFASYNMSQYQKWSMCACTCVFSSFVSTVFTKSVASSFVATQVISHQQKVEVTTVIPYASESVTIDDLLPNNPIPNNLLIKHFHFLVPAIKDITKCTWPLFGSVIIKCHTHKMPFTSAVGLYNLETKRSGPTQTLILWSNYLQKFIIQQFRFIYLFVIAHTLCILNPWSHPPPNLVGKGNSIWARVH